MARRRVLGIVLAGGAGSRLASLTDGRCKPAVSFGGRYRLIDFAQSNLVNGGCRDVAQLAGQPPGQSGCGGTLERMSHAGDDDHTRFLRLEGSPAADGEEAVVSVAAFQLAGVPRWTAIQRCPRSWPATTALDEVAP